MIAAMMDFATILARLEEASSSTDRANPFELASLASACARSDSAPPPDDTNDRATLVSAAYGALSSGTKKETKKTAPRPPAQPARLPDREAFLADLRKAEGSVADLRALRRRLAWICHPDRQEKARARRAERLMAEFNARIDAAIARAPATRARLHDEGPRSTKR